MQDSPELYTVPMASAGCSSVYAVLCYVCGEFFHGRICPSFGQI